MTDREARPGPEPTRPTGPAPQQRRRHATNRGLFLLAVSAVLLVLHGIPWLLLVASPHWPSGVLIGGSVLAVVAVIGFPVAMWLGHGRGNDVAAVLGDTWLGIIWQLFAWSVLAAVARLLLALSAVPEPWRSRGTALGAVAIVLLLSLWGYRAAMRVPRVRRRTIVLPRLGAGLDGLRVVLIADTHFGPIDRATWSRRLVEVVNGLDADVVVHAGDLADGTVHARAVQVAPLADVRARLARAYITGNHEYFSDAAAWVGHMEGLGWSVLHNAHLLLERDGDRIALAGVDDMTAAGSGVPGHHADLTAALSGLDPSVPVVLLAHQPKFVRTAAAAGIDLQLSGHTHGGQIWPFHLLVRAEQHALAGLSIPAGRTQLYVSRGTGFWGPPFRVFAPSEITLLTLHGHEPHRHDPGADGVHTGPASGG